MLRGASDGVDRSGRFDCDDTMWEMKRHTAERSVRSQLGVSAHREAKGMRRFLVLFNHTLTDAQVNDARVSLGVERIRFAPDPLRELWRSIPPGADALEPLLAPARAWLDEEALPGDFVLVQGDFGAVFLIVRHCLARGLMPVYSTTIRDASEETGEGGAVRLRHTFRHVKFRKYGE